MTEERFITRPMSLWLDLVRALAALAVVFGHSFRLDLNTGPLVVSRALEKDAVVVFFVLSGLVIAASVDRGRHTLGAYAIARVSRILPVTIGATLVAVAIAALDANLGAAPMFAEHRDWADPVEMLQALFFLSDSYNSSFALNHSHWSLCYEVWFYALFAAATFASGRARWLWLAVLAVAAGPNVLLLLPTWLVGAWIARDPAALAVPADRARIFVMVALASLFVVPQAAPGVFEIARSVLPWDLGYSLYGLSDLALALAVGLGFIGLRSLSTRGWVLPAASERPIRFLANCSFSLYLLHWPLLKLVKMLGIGAGDSELGLFAIVLAVVAVSAAFATVTEHRRYAVRAMLESFARRRRPALETGISA